MTLKQIPRQARVIPYTAGGEYNCDGITGSVELIQVPAVCVTSWLFFKLINETKI